MKCKWLSNSDYSIFRGKTILVAGGTGFIGKRAVEIFADIGMKVFVLSRNVHVSTDRVKYTQVDLNDIDALKNAFTDLTTFDYSVYMAANIPLRGTQKENFYGAKRSTFDPFINFCNAFLQRINSFVYTSSIDVLGTCTEFEYDETIPVGFATPYGLAKYIGELYTKSMCHEYNIPFTILRYSQVYGPHEPVVRIIPIIKTVMNEGKQFILTTDGNERRRFLYIDDAVKAILHGLLYAKYANSGTFNTYNIAGPDIISMKDLIKLIEKTWKKSIDLLIKGEIAGKDNVPSYENAKRDLHYTPDIGIKDGMRMIMEEEQC